MLRRLLIVLPALLVTGALTACASRVETPEGGLRGSVDGSGDGFDTRLRGREYDPDREGNWDFDVDRR
jgi:hypothetical protein